MNKSAIILGATGLTGAMLLEKLLKDDRYGKIKLFSRSSVNLQHPKIEEHLINLFQLEDYREQFKADEVFCCIGTTAAKTPDREQYRKIDFGIPVMAAELCKENGIPVFVVVSALGANSKSGIFYNRIKGEMEEAVLAVPLQKTYILQPSLIGGERKEKRTGELFFKGLMKFADFMLIGPLKKHRSIHPGTIAKAMIWLANNEYGKARIESDKIQEIAKEIERVTSRC